MYEHMLHKVFIAESPNKGKQQGLWEVGRRGLNKAQTVCGPMADRR